MLAAGSALGAGTLAGGPPQEPVQRHAPTDAQSAAQVNG
jgi:hypothetical protein